MARKPRKNTPIRPISRRGKTIHYTNTGGPPYCGQRQEKMQVVTTDNLNAVNCKKCHSMLGRKGKGAAAAAVDKKWSRKLVALPETYSFKPSKKDSDTSEESGRA